ncbi:unnamed protein product, partial [Mesorhabditis spiculigera]
MFIQWRRAQNAPRPFPGPPTKNLAHFVEPAAPPPPEILLYTTADQRGEKDAKSPVLLVKPTRASQLRTRRAKTQARTQPATTSKMGPPPSLQPIRMESDLSRSPTRENPLFLRAQPANLSSSWSFGTIDKPAPSTTPVLHPRPWRDPVTLKKTPVTQSMETLLALENNLFFANRIVSNYRFIQPFARVAMKLVSHEHTVDYIVDTNTLIRSVFV